MPRGALGDLPAGLAALEVRQRHPADRLSTVAATVEIVVAAGPLAGVAAPEVGEVVVAPVAWAPPGGTAQEEVAVGQLQEQEVLQAVRELSRLEQPGGIIRLVLAVVLAGARTVAQERLAVVAVPGQTAG